VLNEDPEENYTYIKLKGTTMSGHSFKTTIGNTLDSLILFYFYCEQAGILHPWEAQSDVIVYASGDDVIYSAPET